MSCIEGKGCSFKINFLKWSDCKTFDKKIGFIVGQYILTPAFSITGRAFNGSISLLEKTGKVLKISQAVKFLLKPIQWTTNFLGDQLKKIEFIWKKNGEASLNPVQKNEWKGLKKVANWTIIPFYQHLLKPSFSLIKKIFQSVFEICKEPLKKVAGKLNSYVISPFINKVLAPIFKQIKKVAEFILNKLGTVLKLSWNWGVVPAFKHIISPSYTFISNLIWGAMSGTNAKEEPPVLEV